MLDRMRLFWRKTQLKSRKEYEELIRQNYKPIYAYLRRMSGSTDEAQDLCQETFAKVWKALIERPRSGNLRAWIYCIARNTWLNSCRNRGRMVSRTDEWWENLPDPNHRDTKTMVEREFTEILARKVQELDKEKSESIILHYYQGLTLREIAEVMGVATSTVKYRLRESLKILREEMTNEDLLPHDSVESLKKEINCHEV